ncbi:MAG TPA: hypothetical protein VH120_15175, partial [Gemmataceae bacterium]|nr:hypothetical protein [Gemmataceae bacterium]
DLGRRLAHKQTYIVRVKQSGAYTKPYQHKVTILVGDAEIAWFRSPENATIWNWENAVTPIDWQAGQSFGLTLKHKDSLAGERHVGGTLALPALADSGGKVRLIVAPSWQGYFADGPFVVVTVDEIGPEQLRLIKNYLDPGSAW